MLKLSAALVLTLAAGASAQALYRCGSTFSDQPCGPDTKVLIAPRARAAKLTAPVDVPPPQAQIDANIATCERQTRTQLKDPETARIKSISRGGVSLVRHQGADLYAPVYHMNVNAKNSHGGYTGEKLYICVYAADERTWLYSQEISTWPM